MEFRKQTRCLRAKRPDWCVSWLGNIKWKRRQNENWIDQKAKVGNGELEATGGMTGRKEFGVYSYKLLWFSHHPFPSECEQRICGTIREETKASTVRRLLQVWFPCLLLLDPPFVTEFKSIF
jgi:hypothetical protein